MRSRCLTLRAAYSMARFSKQSRPSTRLLAMVSNCCRVYGWNTTRLQVRGGHVLLLLAASQRHHLGTVRDFDQKQHW